MPQVVKARVPAAADGSEPDVEKPEQAESTPGTVRAPAAASSCRRVKVMSGSWGYS